MTWGGGDCKLHLRGMSVFERSQEAGYKSIQVNLNLNYTQLITFPTIIQISISSTAGGTPMINIGLESTRIILTRGRQTTTWVRFVLCHLLCSFVENVYVYWRINFPSPITPVYYDFSNQCVLEDRMGSVGWTIEPPIHSPQIGNMLMTRSVFFIQLFNIKYHLQ